MSVVLAKFKHARISPQKARVVVNDVRGMSAESAVDWLTYSKKKAAKMVLKVLESAIANAEHNESMDVSELKIAEIFVDEGPRQKRWKARAKGRSARIIKRTCHITVGVSSSN